jgi:hypothetical protein
VAASRQPPLGEQSRGNQDAITIRLMSHQGHSASDSLVAGGRLALRASEALAASGAAPSVISHDVIMKQS